MHVHEPQVGRDPRQDQRQLELAGHLERRLEPSLGVLEIAFAHGHAATGRQRHRLAVSMRLSLGLRHRAFSRANRRGEVALLAERRGERAPRPHRCQDLAEQTRRGTAAVDGANDVGHEARRLGELAAGEVDLARALLHLDLEVGASRVGRELSGARRLFERPGVVAEERERRRQVSDDPRQSRAVARRRGEGPTPL